MMPPHAVPIKAILATLIFVFHAALLWADQTVTGDCNTVIGDNNTLGNITVICLPNQESKANFAPLILEMSAEGLKTGATAFDLIIKNKTNYATALFTPAWLSLQDSKGSALRLNCLHRNMDCVTQQYVRPDGVNRLRIVIQDPIPSDLTGITFLLQHIGYLSAASTSSNLMGFVGWSLPLEAGTAPLICKEQISCEQQARLQISLRTLGYDPGRTDGIFDGQTRAAIQHWQRDGQNQRLAPANGCLSPRDITRLKVQGIERSFEVIAFDQSCHATQTAAPNPGQQADLNAQQQETVPTGSIEDIQKELARLGYYLGGIDGAWGPNSAMGLRAAQARLDKAQTGNVQDGLLLLSALMTLPDPPDCSLRFSPFDGQLYQRPDRFSASLGKVPQRRFQVLQQIPGAPAYWFQINTGDRIGWVNDFGHIDVNGAGCRR